MNYFVTTGSLEGVMYALSPEEAAVNFLGIEDGPFGVLVAVSEGCFNVVDAHFFHTKTLLKELKRRM